MKHHERTAAATGLDAVTLKPTKHDLSRASDLPFAEVVIDFEGREHLPPFDLLATVAETHRVRLTTPVRADGFDPLGDDSLLVDLPDGVGLVVVAGNPDYLSAPEAQRTVSNRLRAARTRFPDAWVGTENVERVALAVGGPQFELLSATTAREVRALREVGCEEPFVVYAPVVVTDEDDVVLDALGEYLTRREPVARALPDGGRTDARAKGRTRTVLLDAVDDYALVGAAEAIGRRVERLEAAGVDAVVGYPAAGLDAFTA